MFDWREIASTPRPLEGDVLHPDECVIIRLKGQDFRVRPLQLPRGIRYIPQFGEGVVFREVVDPLGNKPMQEKAKELRKFLESEPDGDLAIVSSVCGYISGLLDQQYNMSSEMKEELFSFCGEVEPPWIQQGIRHAYGMAPIVDRCQEAVLEIQSVVDAVAPED